MTDVEETLRRTFGQAAEQAPGLPPLLPEHLEGVHRRRRRRSRAVLAAAAVVLVAGGTLAVVRGGDTITAVTATRPLSPKPPASVEEVWPQAVKKIPVKGPGGLTWQPITLIDDQTLLLVTSTAKVGRAAALYAYGLDDGTSREIATMPDPDRYGYAGNFAVRAGRVAWGTLGKGRVHLWSAPLDGGKTETIGSQSLPAGDDGSGIDVLEITNGKVVFSFYAGGVFSVPLGGGTVTPVTGDAGMHLLTWPWIGAPGRGGEPHGTVYAQITNVETGEKRSAVTKQGEDLDECGVTICVGTTEEGKGFFRHRDGSAHKLAPSLVFQPRSPSQDRFYVSTFGDGAGLYDLDTGESGDLGLRQEGQFMSLPSQDDTGRLLSYTLGDRLHVIDLAKIE
ncbi:hypothetical protein AB0I81_04645 [Nonomuraea sp. NPDC050404]|uniref:hypothetical protein n=1 Tax=Nonomuraea sp. NPDC050404 TaxID=3155783 RepID=UPI0033E7D767